MSRYFLPAVVGCCLLAAVVGAGMLIYQRISPSSNENPSTIAPAATPLAPGDATPVRLSPQARENLGLVSKPLKLTNYWRTLEVPGVIVDRPGVSDRGVIAPGLRADLNLIDLDAMALHAPEMVFDLPAGGRRLIQRADGYVATLVAGQVTQEHGQPTGERPGRLVRF